MISMILLKAKNIVSVRLDEDSYNDLIDQANNDNVTITEKCREHIENGISGSFDEQEPRIEYREKEVIKEVPKIEYRDKIIEVPGPTQYIQVPGPTQYIERPKPIHIKPKCEFTCSAGSDNHHINVE